MNERLVYVALGAAAVLLVALLAWLFGRMRSGSKSAGQGSTPAQKAGAMPQGLLVTCPLCNSPLQKGQNLVTKVYRPMTVPDQLCTINGCPHCYPMPQPGVARSCPVCHKAVPLSGHLTARLFNKTDGKKHVVVTGCSECCKRNAD